MTVIVGIGATDDAAPTAAMLKALAFEGQSCVLVHVNEPVYVPAIGVTTGPLISPDMLETAQKARDEAGEAALAKANAAFANAGIKAVPMSIDGLATDMLVSCADSHHAKLIAIRSERKAFLESLLIGSVGRSLASAATQSVLLVRGVNEAPKALTVVIATDHSDYATRAVDAFLAMKPKGIGKVVVVSGSDTQMAAAGLALSQGYVLEALPDQAPLLEQRSVALAERLKAELGCQVETRVLREPPIPAIAHAVKDADADLLVIGAKGHGLLHRVVLGSVAMHFVGNAPCSLLLMRA